MLDSGGQPATGTVDLVFTLFDAPTAGTAVWTESLVAVPLVDGVYSVTLGATTPITPGLLAAGSLFLEIAADGETLSPRQPLLAVPYAVRAADSDAVGGFSSDFVTQVIQQFAFDGGDLPNDDPSEGTGDTDGDGIANFIDPDNDGDGLSDAQELAQGADINVVTPNIDASLVTPFTSGTTDVSVTGTFFVAGMTGLFDGVPVTLQNVTPTSFDFTALVMGAAGPRTLVVTRLNGEFATADVQVDPVVPTISSIGETSFPSGLTDVDVVGTNFDPGMAVTFDGGGGHASERHSDHLRLHDPGGDVWSQDARRHAPEHADGER